MAMDRPKPIGVVLPVPLRTSLKTPPTPEVHQAIEYILKEPPKKQFIVNGSIEWRDIAPQSNSNAEILFQYIRRVRNNLFHGGKFNDP